jgi:6-phosphogluconolactonase
MIPATGALRVFPDAEALARGAAEFLCERGEAAHGRFTVCLSGGSTPKRLYQLLAARPFVHRFPWDRAQFAFGDERFVLPDDPDSNARMAREAMLSQAPVPPDHVHAIPTIGMTPDESASAYQRTLETLYGGSRLETGRPLFDVCLLGVGDDGHTASLIPGQPVLQERTRWVAAVAKGRPEVRITLTFPALEASRTVAFLVAGEGKRAILDRLLSGDRTVPAGMLRPAGEVIWFADRAAAGRWAR